MNEGLDCWMHDAKRVSRENKNESETRMREMARWPKTNIGCAGRSVTEPGCTAPSGDCIKAIDASAMPKKHELVSQSVSHHHVVIVL